MKEALQSIVAYWFLSNLWFLVRQNENDLEKQSKVVKKLAGISKPVRALISIVIFAALFGKQVQNFIQTKEPNYFELLELENTMPSPILVKK